MIHDKYTVSQRTENIDGATKRSLYLAISTHKQSRSRNPVHGGSVYAVEHAQIPGEGPLAAVFRY
ncbi:MAG: hypothetical protein M3Y76_11925 [Chloroflexota bacterium]|nr:hypothetical protein [Chloroflexota bacterium]